MVSGPGKDCHFFSRKLKRSILGERDLRGKDVLPSLKEYQMVCEKKETRKQEEWGGV